MTLTYSHQDQFFAHHPLLQPNKEGSSSFRQEEIWNPKYSVPGVAGKEAVRETVLRQKCSFSAIGLASV